MLSAVSTPHPLPDTVRYIPNPFKDPPSAAEITQNPPHLSPALRKAFEKAIQTTVEGIVTECPPDEVPEDPGVYVGYAGLAYTFWRLSTSPSTPASTSSYYSTLSSQYLNSALSALNPHDRHIGFLCTNTGTLALYALIQRENHPDAARACLEQVLRRGERGVVDEGEWDEVLYGRA
ncbi:hypothetical protein HK102_006370, partial [Quaeritorhiza haematococci]